MTEIVPNLWLGDQEDSRDIERYDVVVNCTTDLPFVSLSKENIRIPVLDKDFENEIPKLKERILLIIQIIDSRLRDGKKILVHCGAGQSRSPTVVACLLLYQNPNLSVDDIIKKMRKQNSNVFFGRISFREVLEYVSDNRNADDILCGRPECLPMA